MDSREAASYTCSLKSGAIAQQGERNTGSVEVGGSIPPGSTKPEDTFKACKDAIFEKYSRVNPVRYDDRIFFRAYRTLGFSEVPINRPHRLEA